MKRTISGLLACTLIVLGLALLGFISNKPKGVELQFLTVVSVTPTVDPGPGYVLAPLPVPTTDADNLPLYPDSQLLKDDKSYIPTQRNIYYQTSASIQELSDFYTEQLKARGWNKDPSFDDPTIGAQYDWSDKAGVVPFRLKLWLNIDEETSESRTVDLTLYRLPLVHKFPIQPDAEQIKVSYGMDEFNMTGRIIMYLSSARLEEAEAYYMQNLEYYGWLVGKSPDDPANVIQFMYRHGGFEPGVGEHAGGTITVNADASGKTRVEVKISGDALALPDSLLTESKP